MVTLTLLCTGVSRRRTFVSSQRTHPDISGSTTRTGHLNRAPLDECLNGDCPSLNACEIACYGRKSLNIRPGNGACIVVAEVTNRFRTRESRVQGEGKQVFQVVGNTGGAHSAEPKRITRNT
jgi:hypothetical protein